MKSDAKNSRNSRNNMILKQELLVLQIKNDAKNSGNSRNNKNGWIWTNLIMFKTLRIGFYSWNSEKISSSKMISAVSDCLKFVFLNIENTSGFLSKKSSFLI